MTLGVIARADNSGLATICWEVCRHLRPDRVLIVNMGSLNRGGYFPERYDALCDEVYVTRPLFEPAPLHAFLDNLDVVFGAETFYDPRFDAYAREAHVERVLYVMPELTNTQRLEQHAEHYYLPCEWEGPHGHYPVLPMPVALDRFPQREVNTPARTFAHVPAAAMEDRAGTEALLAALPYVEHEVEIVIAGSNGKGEDRQWHVANATVTWLNEAAENYWDVMPPCDAFISPRRYGVLGLPFLEAAASGLPIVSTYLPPQSNWLDWRALCACRDSRVVQMKGGYWDVFHPDPVDLASRIDLLAADAQVCAELAAQNRKYAEANSWDVLRPEWERQLR